MLCSESQIGTPTGWSDWHLFTYRAVQRCSWGINQRWALHFEKPEYSEYRFCSYSSTGRVAYSIRTDPSSPFEPCWAVVHWSIHCYNTCLPGFPHFQTGWTIVRMGERAQRPPFRSKWSTIRTYHRRAPKLYSKESDHDWSARSETLARRKFNGHVCARHTSLFDIRMDQGETRHTTSIWLNTIFSQASHCKQHWGFLDSNRYIKDVPGCVRR